MDATLVRLRVSPGAARTAIAGRHGDGWKVRVAAAPERGRVLAVTEGRVDGLILEAPRGSGGFGYDPLFFYPPLGKTFAELDPEEKFAVSHRGEAFRKLLNDLTAQRR